MNNSEFKETRFDAYCSTCKHYAAKYLEYGISNEAQEPCNTCLEIGMREGTEKPEYWEEK